VTAFFNELAQVGIAAMFAGICLVFGACVAARILGSFMPESLRQAVAVSLVEAPSRQPSATVEAVKPATTKTAVVEPQSEAVTDDGLAYDM